VLAQGPAPHIINIHGGIYPVYREMISSSEFYLGYGSANYYKATGQALVRNVWLPAGYDHVTLPNTRHLLKSQQILDWINQYHPSGKSVDRPQLDVTFDADSKHVLWAAEVWYSIKKHWVLELQRWIRAGTKK
jgi:hypothetical protein